MKQAEFVAFEQNVIEYRFLTLNFILIQWRSLPGGRRRAWSYTRQKCQQQNSWSHFVQMLQTLSVSSTFEVIIMFPGQNFIQIAIHGDNVW